MDFDSLDQLRIVGPGNHLFLGLSGIYKDDLSVEKVYSKSGKLYVELIIKKNDVFLPDPVVRNVRRVRRLTEVAYEKRKNYQELVNQYPDLEPNYIYAEQLSERKRLFFRRRYAHHWYGSTFNLPKDIKLSRDERRRGFHLKLEGRDHIPVLIIAESDKIYRRKVKTVLTAPIIDLGVFDDKQELISNILDRTQAEIEHLITYDKTSGFEYGTIFPRDWMEAADLGEGDFPQEIIDYMYAQALKFVTKKGMGWHEDIVGEFRHERLEASAMLEANARIITRHMIDIEPRYILGLKVVSPEFVKENKMKLKNVAKFILSEARSKKVATFRKKPPRQRLYNKDEYWDAGNWRDSRSAYRYVSQPIAPYDVNVVYYPAALRLIRDFLEVLELEAPDIEDLILKWDKNQKRYEFFNEDGLLGSALALYEVEDNKNLTFKSLRVNHTDEASLFMYLEPAEDEALSFARRLLNSEYFFTPAGPTVVDHKSGFGTLDYHGEVIWIKQTAYTVLGLSKVIDSAYKKGWSDETIKILRNALLVTAENTIMAIAAMRGVPELYYFDSNKDRAAYYDSQEGIEAQMSKIQLWSAVGSRQIIRQYYKIVKG
ncbi:MAG: hypothetical protein UU65_C0003G0250 [candidate division CPR2 bacterium GW2011_GWC1_41_48]|uniref:Uncharacterized protein n=1 Tax=candidate division CPR2 bacterium GW2011_GWC1_41_48 TaxID=1618344 RepID=A0A0G0W892_UNCC2|nr:MAG: hypothetical protein UT47_C0003G0256 [candidate division CPR2 bacterium GW2011_GWC2_39_35]KKR29271.1 MAG: hypothetical protein UT60_C0004G0008 [candidate division CPR2 bacterium GW2011_GWD2_39_7]KKS09195.1 MAG: hypothetical protein UU65_C0003G0250 [candidate division CPR2 bacterium GW2011_GWC1_41_48]